LGFEETRSEGFEIFVLVFDGRDSKPRGNDVNTEGDVEGAVMDVPDADFGGEADAVAKTLLHELGVESGDESEGGESDLVGGWRDVGNEEHVGAFGEAEGLGDALVHCQLEIFTEGDNEGDRCDGFLTS
jgi:hypothetical protein